VSCFTRGFHGRTRPLAAVVVVGIAFSLGFGSTSTAVKRVREGIRHFANLDFEAAGKAFMEADVAEPENLAITFDRACALAAAGDGEKARALFQQSALARDTDLAARSHYNLGSQSAVQGRAALGDQPVSAAPEQRQQGLALLLAAAGHYRDCLQIDSDHADARHNLELIRLFVKNIEAQWEEQDRDTAREEMGLIEFLAMIRQRQLALRSTVRVLTDEADSPQRRQTLHDTSEEQAKLQEEIEPLQAKIAEQFQAPQQPQPGASDPNSDPANAGQMEQARNLLSQLAGEAGSMMIDAASTIEAGQFSKAAARQRDVLDQLNQIFMAVAPFSGVLQRAVQQQDQLTATSVAMTQDQASDSSDARDSADEETPDSAAADSKSQADYPELQWRQSRVTDWSRMLSLKAESELPGVEAQLQAAPSQPSGAGTAHANDDDQATPHASTDGGNAQLEALQQSLIKAIELAPKVEQHCSSAATQLGKSDPNGAFPDQQQAQQLLREIAEPLAQENQQQEDQQQDDQPGDDGNQEDQSQAPEQQPSQSAAQDPPQTGESPQQRAMSVLRRARQREREHRDLQKQLQQMVGGRVGVDRDW